MKELFSKIAGKTSEAIGSPWAFVIALGAIFVWLISGPVLGFSDTWQLIINTSTTIVTFLTVFLIQHTQNKNDRATQLKLDEIIHSIKSARNDFIDLEDLTEEKLIKLRKEYNKLKKTPSRKKRI
jgi:low affinity Fe/Cu permease